MASLVLTIIGTDRPGLVEALADVVAAHDGNWERSRVAELAGTFAGVVVVSVPTRRVDEFRAAVEPLRERGLLDVVLRPAPPEEGPDADPVVDDEGRRSVAFSLVGNDRPGIVREVSSLLASMDVSITDMRTWTESAAMAGGSLFHARATVALPAEVTWSELVDRLEELADELMVDLGSVAPPATTD